jgi:hypothetical protein
MENPRLLKWIALTEFQNVFNFDGESRCVQGRGESEKIGPASINPTLDEDVTEFRKPFSCSHPSILKQKKSVLL